MFSSLFNDPVMFLLWGVALIVAITVHEFAHAWMADRLGDPTAKLAGRLTLNPLRHLDLVGTLLLFIMHFGWGKPVPVDPFNLRNPRRDNAVISLSGPASNILTAVICSLILRLLIASSLSVASIILVPIIVMCINLAIFNLIPIHPLDGFAVVEGLLPEEAARQWHQLQSLGVIMLLVLVFPLFGSSPVLSAITPVINMLIAILIPQVPVM